MYDLIVLGAGPGGYEAAARAGRMGKKTAIIEKQYLGGTCLNVGCIPTKVFLKSSKLYTDCQNGSVYGVRVSSVQFDLAALVERKNQVVGALTQGVETLLKRSKVEVIRGEGKLTSRSTLQVGSESYEAKNILIATGSRPARPPIKGLDSPGVLDSNSVFGLTALPGRVAIIGGGYIGLEFASFFAGAGSRVTVFEMLPQIAAGCDGDISRRLLDALQKQGIEIKTSCKVNAVSGRAVEYEDSEGVTASLEADCVLNATGRAPVVEGIGLETAGVDFDHRGIKTSERGKTNVPGVWACGDVTGRRLLAHAATREGLVAVANMFGGDERVRYDAIPSVIYTHPEVSSAGKTEEELKAQGVEYKKSTVPMALAGRFLIENPGGSGIVKVLVGAKYGEILGVHMLGDLSSEFIVAAAAMIETEMCASDVAEIVFPHPTVSEALKEAILRAAE
ncbi:MAG: dihydrolipoyl dehydrogenase [Bryobacterales bacterium]|nr:dihydrolipoyl dehydrogenase [Bryobacterales bacterium]